MAFDNFDHGKTGKELIKERMFLLLTDEGIRKGLGLKPRPDDVFIVTYPKCGTTWMQQILHQLRSGGDMSFDEICDVIPCLESAYDCGLNVEEEQKYKPRCFKTHAWHPVCPKGAKYIVIYREPCAAFFSFFNFYEGWIFQPGEVSLHKFVKECLVDVDAPRTNTELASYFYNLLSWWEHRNDSNVLFLFYEDMKDDLESVVRMVGEFIGIQEEEKIKKAVEMSSFEYMKANERKFSEIRLPRMRNKIMGVSGDVVPSKVVTGSATRGRELMDEKTKEVIQAKWSAVVCKETGFQNYNELRNAFKKEKINKSKKQF